MKAPKETIEGICNELDMIKKAISEDFDQDLTILIIDNVKDRDTDNCITIGTTLDFAKLIIGFLENNPKVFDAMYLLTPNNDE